MPKKDKPVCSGGEKKGRRKARFFLEHKALYCGRLGKCDNKENMEFFKDGTYKIVIKGKSYTGKYYLYENRITLAYKVRFLWLFTITHYATFFKKDDDCLLDADRRELRCTGPSGLVLIKWNEQPELFRDIPKKKRKKWWR